MYTADHIKLKASSSTTHMSHRVVEEEPMYIVARTEPAYIRTSCLGGSNLICHNSDVAYIHVGRTHDLECPQDEPRRIAAGEGYNFSNFIRCGKVRSNGPAKVLAQHPELLKDGHCVPCSIAQLHPKIAGNLTAMMTPYSTYSHYVGILQAVGYELEATVGLHLSAPGTYLVHSGRGRHAHCVSVDVSLSGQCKVMDGLDRIETNTAYLEWAHSQSEDSASVMTIRMSSSVEIDRLYESGD